MRVYGLATQWQSIMDAAKNKDWDLGGTRSIQLILSLMSLHQNCFTGETLVAAENGQIRIDEIEVGDKVWAYDIFTGETALKEVTKVYVHEVDEILHLHTSCGDIDTTTNHPFFVIDRGWVAAGDLVEGDEIYLLDGTVAYVTGSELEQLPETIKVYNLEVEDFNTYFVGDEAVLVHNYQKNPNAQEYDVVQYGDNIKGSIGSDGKQMEKHHGMLDQFFKEVMPGYNSKEAPTVVLSASNHNATKSVYMKWAWETFGGSKVDWSKVTMGDMFVLADRMFDSASVPQSTRNSYFSQLTNYLGGLL